MLEQAGPFANHDRLDDLNASRNHQQPPEKQHGDDRGRHGAHDCENPEQRQADAESQKPAPVMDDLRRNSHIQSLNLAHGVSLRLQKARRPIAVVKLILPVHSVWLGTRTQARPGRLPQRLALSTLVVGARGATVQAH